MQKIIRRTTRRTTDGKSISQTIVTIYGGPDVSEIERVKAAFDATMERGRKERRWLLAFGAAVLTLEALILTLWRG